MNGWVSTRDMLPVDGNRVIVCAVDGNAKYRVLVASRNNKTWYPDDSELGGIDEKMVEYWKPMPAPPKFSNGKTCSDCTHFLMPFENGKYRDLFGKLQDSLCEKDETATTHDTPACDNIRIGQPGEE
jgi:hypothetical protein